MPNAPNLGTTAEPRSNVTSVPPTETRAPLPSLVVSIVVYYPDMRVLRDTVVSFVGAARKACARGTLGAVALDVVDNGSAAPSTLDQHLRAWVGEQGDVALRIHRGHGNVGYGRGHNLSILSGTASYHLILNPDVRLDESSVSAAITFLERHPGVGMVTPQVHGEDGARQFLCRRYPSVFTLALRGIAPEKIRRRFSHRLDRYELRDAPPIGVTRGIEIASGCFMFARGETLRAVGGFADEFFLYFEDYDLSLRLRRHADIAYVDDVRVVHAGGGVPRKGWRHILRYVRSAITFFRKHGWQWR